MNPIIIGHLRVRERTLYHNRSKPRNGLKASWTEYQVWNGRRIVARHDLLHHAIKDAEQRLDKHWDEIGRALKEMEKT